MQAETAIYEKAIEEARSLIAREAPGGGEVDKILEQAQKDTDTVRLMRAIAKEEIEKAFNT